MFSAGFFVLAILVMLITSCLAIAYLVLQAFFHAGHCFVLSWGYSVMSHQIDVLVPLCSILYPFDLFLMAALICLPSRAYTLIILRVFTSIVLESSLLLMFNFLFPHCTSSLNVHMSCLDLQPVIRQLFVFPNWTFKPFWHYSSFVNLSLLFVILYRRYSNNIIWLMVIIFYYQFAAIFVLFNRNLHVKLFCPFVNSVVIFFQSNLLTLR